MKGQASDTQFATCIRNDDYGASLETRKVYQLIPDSAAEHNLLRVVDESGEDYLYPSSYFVLVDLPEDIGRALPAAS